MGFVRRLFGAEKASPGESIDTLMFGEAPKPARGAPFRARLRAGDDIELSVNVAGIDRDAVGELLGVGEDDFVDRTVRVTMFRDLESDLPDSVLVHTRKGRRVGTVVEAQSYFACELVNQAGEGVAAIDPTFQGRAPHLDVAMRVEGYRDPEGTIRRVEAATIGVSLPVRVVSFAEAD